MRRGYRSRPHWFHAAVLLIVVGCAYGPTVGFDFVWDDHLLIVDNAPRLGSEQWTRAFAGSFWSLHLSEDTTRSFYRPLVSISYMLDHALWGLKPAGFHLTNLAIYALCTLLVYALCARYVGRPGAALGGALVYAVHPTHVENVAWISGRTDLLCALFFLVGCLTFERSLRAGLRSTAWLVAAVVSYGFALLSKEMAITLPAVLALIWWFDGRVGRAPTRVMLGLGAFALVTVAYLAVRAHILGNAVVAPASVRSIVFSVPMVFGKYVGAIGLLVAPDPHHADGFVSDPFTAAQLGYLTLGCLVVAWLATSIRRRGLATFAGCWFVITLAPVFNLGAFGDVLIADRFLNIPSVGWALLVAAFPLAVAGERMRRLTYLGITGYLVLSVVSLRGYLPHWSSDERLFGFAVRNSPNSAYVQMNLGRAQRRAGRPGEALQSYERAIELDPGDGLNYLQRGVALEDLGRVDDAIRAYIDAYRLGYRGHVLHLNLGNALKDAGRFEEAIAAYWRSLAIIEDHRARNNLGECLLAVGDAAAAERQFRRSLVATDGRIVRNNLGAALLALGRRAEAAANFERAIEFEPSAPTPHFNLARLLYLEGDRDLAEGHAARALELLREAGELDRLRRFADELREIEVRTKPR